jgi:methylenetetrahydrofolate reductase (NADPH)
MLRVFQSDINDPGHFVITLELVPGRESVGRSVDTVMGIARDAYADGRVSAVSMTDNPGGNPSLSPDALGHGIFRTGMDVIIHFTCRDMNRVGMESRALQLAMMGMKNILALNGDFSGQGFGGQGAPVFDLDSVHLQIMLGILSERIQAAGDPDGFFSGCAVSPFKYTQGESYAQYAKLCRKAAGGAQFVITQLGYDARKFAELIQLLNWMQMPLPALGSVYVLGPAAARIMNQGQVPGALVSTALKEQVIQEWRDKKAGRRAAVERAARLAAILKGLGYRGIHIGGIHKTFDTAGLILDRLEQIQGRWQEFLPDFDSHLKDAFYLFYTEAGQTPVKTDFSLAAPDPGMLERFRYSFLKNMHDLFFNREHLLAPAYARLCRYLDNRVGTRLLMDMVEGLAKRLLLNCQHCGDCGIQHVGFLCPESGCPKHTRNGACGGSRNGRCEVYNDRPCVWFRAYRRLARAGESAQLMHGCVPPRMWELNQTSSWINYHLQRDHQSASAGIGLRCRTLVCNPLPDDMPPAAKTEKGLCRL